MSTELTTVEAQPADRGSMVEAVSSRQAQEIQAAMVIAQRFPRDEEAAIARIMTACKRLKLAEKAMYKYARGGTKITGPSIRLAEVMARAWGNVDFGIVELDQRQGESDVMAYCWDLETNTRQTKIFTQPHARYSKERGLHALADPRDIYEQVANMGARRMRACILGIIPGDVQDLAIEECRTTILGDNTEPLIDRLRKAVKEFAEYGVTLAMIEARFGHRLDAAEPSDLVDLREIYQSMRDGMSKREDWFDVHAEASADHKRQAAEAAESQPAPFDSKRRMAGYRARITKAKGNAEILDKLMCEVEADGDLAQEDITTLQAEIEAAAKPKGEPKQRELLK
jgi:hypothetical protein